MKKTFKYEKSSCKLEESPQVEIDEKGNEEVILWRS